MLIIAHLTLMMAALICLIAGVAMAMFGRKNKSWLKWHKNFNLTGSILLIAGAVMAAANVVTSDGVHLAAPHHWLGSVAFLLTCLTVFLGFSSFKAVNKPAARSLHRWSGRVSLVAVVGAFVLGLRMIGIL